MYLVNESNPAAISLAKKMSEHKHKQDGILNCTPEEIACTTNGDFTSFNLTHEGSPLQKVEAGGSYILFADHGTEIDDAFHAAESLGINLGVVRIDDIDAVKDRNPLIQFGESTLEVHGEPGAFQRGDK